MFGFCYLARGHITVKFIRLILVGGVFKNEAERVCFVPKCGDYMQWEKKNMEQKDSRTGYALVEGSSGRFYAER
jgi:hypothetical protein